MYFVPYARQDTAIFVVVQLRVVIFKIIDRHRLGTRLRRLFNFFSITRPAGTSCGKRAARRSFLPVFTSFLFIRSNVRPVDETTPTYVRGRERERAFPRTVGAYAWRARHGAVYRSSATTWRVGRQGRRARPQPRSH